MNEPDFMGGVLTFWVVRLTPCSSLYSSEWKAGRRNIWVVFWWRDGLVIFSYSIADLFFAGMVFFLSRT